MNATATEIIARAVIRRDGQLLLVRQYGKSWSFLPGGHLEPGERVESALVRELGEELGIEATIVGLLGVIEHGYIDDDTTHHELNFVFEVNIADAEPTSQEAHLGFHWLPIDNLARSDVRPSSLKDVLLSPADERAPFWRGWAI
ncbi:MULTISPECIES: NUDIX domain-containing protein [Pseudonocardiaceae]|uniref:NUDIX domain-containing protein n=1 Tax=Prauserella endophytica TaxID=1592324 RepID=A0ABY2RV95_9PSEU|nr:MULTISPECIES: NUDIX domain-containing protein [Pseudonocardiaceae]TKG60237.1 NUDIX domain-containing protein [Prauserella endophytica]